MDRPRRPPRGLSAVAAADRAHPRAPRRHRRRRRLPPGPQPLAGRPPPAQHPGPESLGRPERLPRPDGRHRLLPGPRQHRTTRHPHRQGPRTDRPLARTRQPPRPVPDRDRPGPADLLGLPALQHQRLLPPRPPPGRARHRTAQLSGRRLVRPTRDRHPRGTRHHPIPHQAPGAPGLDHATRLRQRHPRTSVYSGTVLHLDWNLTGPVPDSTCPTPAEVTAIVATVRLGEADQSDDGLSATSSTTTTSTSTPSSRPPPAVRTTCGHR
ncbi:protein of unknown function [Streptantibioticus cattleyicolor NRRL 8057 = DSM 46488]|nr:protein of unknown function [Streptantibioticus cattleyicolor NRRL 8057 = DSM 46488]